MTSFRCSRAFTLSLVVALLLACGVRQDEFDCENAAAHLQECCAGFSATRISCTYSSAGCSTTYPEINIADADCIRGESCEELVATGVCGRVQNPGTNTAIDGATSAMLCGPGATFWSPDASDDAGGDGGAGIAIGCLSIMVCRGGGDASLDAAGDATLDATSDAAEGGPEGGEDAQGVAVGQDGIAAAEE